MALTGEDKEMRMPTGPLGYDDPLENLDHSTTTHHHHIQHPQDQLIPQDKSPRVPPGATTAALNSGGSKSRAPPPTGRSITSRYRECLKNHAASIGGNVTDGCGEFMPSGEEGTLEALKCAACHCHRNFHRKEHNGDGAIVVHQLQLPPPLPSPSMNQHRGGGGESMHLHNSNWTTMVQPVKMAFGSGSASAATDSSSEELNFNAFQSSSVPPPPQFVLAKKRFRSKFSQEQKDKMLEFAEKLGWRIPREDDTEVQRFCAEVGVKRQVFKVWMHNNKSSATKKNLQES